MNYSERIYSESEIKLIKEIFDMTIKQIYDENLEKLVSDCKEMFLEHQKSLKEIERLNNIINETNKMIDKIVEEVYKPVDKEWGNILCIIEDYKLKLQELKGCVINGK